MNLIEIPKLAELLENPGRVADLPAEAIAELRGQLAKVDTILLSRLLGSGGNGNGESLETDRLLSAKEVAVRMGVCLDYVYKNASEFPFARKEGRRVLFSDRGLEQYLQKK